MAYEVTTPVYEGPFDLLLHLILREQVDLYEVPLAAIVLWCRCLPTGKLRLFDAGDLSLGSRLRVGQHIGRDHIGTSERIASVRRRRRGRWVIARVPVMWSVVGAESRIRVVINVSIKETA